MGDIDFMLFKIYFHLVNYRATSVWRNMMDKCKKETLKHQMREEHIS